MYYNTLCDEYISALGFGLMRLPTKDGEIEKKKAEELIEQAYDKGINYFDTAYGYLNGKAETFAGEVLSNHQRKTWKIATKMPGHMLRSSDGKLTYKGYMRDRDSESIDAIFHNQLVNLKTDYVDFYLLHNVNKYSIDIYLNPQIGIIDYLLKKKISGEVRHLGFSFHGNTDLLELFLNRCKDVFEFVQIQLNYYDWFFGDAKYQYMLLTDMNIPVIAMEPLRGGRLVDNSSCISTIEGDLCGPELALAFLQDLENVKLVLSGMSNKRQMKDNLNIYQNKRGLSSVYYEDLKKLASRLESMIMCTGCSYCTEVCPKRIDIPTIMEYYNKMISGELTEFDNDSNGIFNCIYCRECEKVCPQEIKPYEILNIMKTIEEQGKAR